MALIPTALPDPERIRELIWQRGYSQADFARKIGRPARTLYAILNDKPQRAASIPLLRQIARGLSTPGRTIKLSDISNWAGDDDSESDAETKVPAA